MGAARYSWIIVASGLAAAPGVAAGQADEAIGTEIFRQLV